MLTIKRRHHLLCGIAILAFAGTSAHADTPKEQELEARIAALERMFGTVQAELATAKSENQKLRADASLAQARTDQLSASVSAIQATPQAATPTLWGVTSIYPSPPRLAASAKASTMTLMPSRPVCG